MDAEVSAPESPAQQSPTQQPVRLTLEQLNQYAQQGQGYDAWLQNLLADMPEFTATLIAVQNQQGSLQPIALWPRQQSHLERLGDLVDECCEQQRPLLLSTPSGSEYGLAYPLFVDSRLVAVFAGYVSAKEEDLDGIMGSVEKHVLWIESRFHRDAYLQLQENLQRQQTVIDGYVAVGKGEAIKQSALQWVDSLARGFDCDRVSLGSVRHGLVTLDVISGSSEFALNNVTAKQITQAMQEACDQRRIIAWPVVGDQDAAEGMPPEPGGIGLQAEKLSLAQRNASVLSVPVYHQDALDAVLTFERPAQAPFTSLDIERVEANLALVGVAFYHRKQAELSFWGSCKHHLKLQLERLLAPGYVKRKLFFISLTALVLFFALARGDYQINADAVLEPRQIRVVSAPFNGYLKSASARAGDRVEAGQTLAAMEDNELRLEKIKAISLLSQNNKQYTEALAERNRAQAQIYAAQMEQAKAQLASAERKLDRSQLKAPFDALVVSGDLSQRIGGSVSQGEELLRLSPMTDYRLILYVNEYRIGDVQVGQRGRVVLSSMPDQSFDFDVETLTPVTEVQDGSTVFRVEARLPETSDQFRPGLVGIAKVSAGRRHLIDIWTMDLRKWLSLKLWSFWG
ncbi:efflux RND transporter periplasmic adaptor subunit [Aestuariicella sp. G3-2]|uniref:efflux RND transporter periplasmic adaptor subunit n=1 Tax=Pseudomaricurvus albidus TaxID=2842452 RepID=UPI001C0E1F6E|nr:efflux RND transporter periplasmic adaptor subunit [Aestuariicella albida]